MENTQTVVNNVRLSYVHLTKPYSRDPQSASKYQATILLPKTDTAGKAAIDAAIAAASQNGVAGKWGGSAPARVATPIWDGDGLTQNGNKFGPECANCWVFTASCSEDRKPEVVDRQLNPILNATEIYSGMYANVSVNFFAYNYNGKKGIGCGLGPVQKVRDGEVLGGAPPAASAVFSAAPAVAPTVAGVPASAAPTWEAQINPLTGAPM